MHDTNAASLMVDLLQSAQLALPALLETQL
jgi:hypothetical protein